MSEIDSELALDIVFAARYGDLDDLKQLIAPHPPSLLSNSTDYNNNTPLHMAAANGHTHIVQFIIQTLSSEKQQLNSNNLASDTDAKEKEKEQQQEISSLAPLNASKNTPLHWAALNGHIDVIRTLCPKLSQAQLVLINAANRTPSEEAEFRATDACLECAGYIDGCILDDNDENDNQLEQHEIDEILTQHQLENPQESHLQGIADLSIKDKDENNDSR